MGRFLFTVILLVSCFACSEKTNQATPAEPASQIGYKSAANAEETKTLLLRDFKPASMLHVPAHNIDKAKFYVIDVHNHINDAEGIEDHEQFWRLQREQCDSGQGFMLARPLSVAAVEEFLTTLPLEERDHVRE